MLRWHMPITGLHLYFKELQHQPQFPHSLIQGHSIPLQCMYIRRDRWLMPNFHNFHASILDWQCSQHYKYMYLLYSWTRNKHRVRNRKCMFNFCHADAVVKETPVLQGLMPCGWVFHAIYHTYVFNFSTANSYDWKTLYCNLHQGIHNTRKPLLKIIH